jgi:hypothetical protein
MYIALSYQRAERLAAIAHAQAKRMGPRAEELTTATLSAALTLDDSYARRRDAPIPHRAYETHAINRALRDTQHDRLS